MAEFKIVGGKVHLVLTPAETRGLHALADEGHSGLMTDDGAARAYIGGKKQQDAAGRAWETLGEACGRLRNLGK